MNSTNAPNRLRSANAPVISAGVIAANISWNEAKRTNGIVARVDRRWASRPTPLNPTKSRPPMRPEAADVGREREVNPTSTQTTLTIASPKKLCMIVERTFLRRTRPP